ncbi:MAG TPA: serine/threonine-protein kinase [Thermoanaerobaculia bacterium]|nr:serine/threonine-protein kinase [Thermoanaerobaculia bacterium]
MSSIASRERALLDRVAGAVGDGLPVDWAQVEQRLSPRSASSTAIGLRYLAELAQRRSLSGTEGERAAFGGWAVRALLALAAVQVLLAVAGFALGSRDPEAIPRTLVLGAMLVFAGAAIVLLGAGARDSRAWPLAGVMLCTAAAMAQPLLARLDASFPGAPLTWVRALLPEAFLPAFCWRFARDFPRLARFDRWSRRIERMVWFSLAAGVLFFAINAWARLGGVTPAPLEPWLRHPTGFYWGALSTLTLTAILVPLLRQRRAPVEERQRVRVFLGGLALGIVPICVQVLAETLLPAYDRLTDHPRWYAVSGTLLYALLLTVPLSSSYAVAARRVLDLRFAVGLAARFALARASLATLALTPIVVLAMSAYRHRALPLTVVFSRTESRAWFAASICGLVLLLLRGPLLRGVEHRLLGRAVSPSDALARFAQTARQAADAAPLLAVARAEAEALLRCEGVAVLQREAGSGLLRDGGGRISSLATESALVRVAAAAPGALVVDRESRGSLYRWLPEEERAWIDHAGLCLMTPVALGEEPVHALLAAGSARSGVPYSAEEIRAFEALASSLSLALERLPEEVRAAAEGPAAGDLPAGECARCGAVRASWGGACNCGGGLTPASLPHLLGGKFRVEWLLGRGGMGVVYRASDLALGRSVALKTLPRLELGPLRRLEQEARSMASLAHPGLATIYGLESWRGVPVLVVEHLPGGTLSQRLHPPWTPRAVVELGIELATALEAMHRRGLLHRDLKPSNIGFTAEGRPKLLDFGLARLFEEEAARSGDEPLRSLLGDRAGQGRLTQSRQLAGTPLYLSPEALLGAPAAPAQDLWALFIVLWEALAGQHPLDHLSFADSLRALARAEVPPIDSVRSDVPEPLARLLAAALSLRPDRRPADAVAARKALEAALPA